MLGVLSALNVVGKPIFALSGENRTAPSADAHADPVAMTDDDRRVLSYYCGPMALTKALESAAKALKIRDFDPERGFAVIVEACDPTVGRGVTLGDLKRAASKFSRVEALGIRFDSPDKLLDLLTKNRTASAVVHLSEGSLGQQHFITITPTQEGEPVAFDYFDPTNEAESRREKPLSSDATKAKLGKASGYALLLQY